MAEPLRPLRDADDTPCENNILFENLIEEFIDYIDHGELAPADRSVGNWTRSRCASKKNRYDSEHNTNNLAECYESLRKRPATTA